MRPILTLLLAICTIIAVQSEIRQYHSGNNFNELSDLISINGEITNNSTDTLRIPLFRESPSGDFSFTIRLECGRHPSDLNLYAKDVLINFHASEREGLGGLEDFTRIDIITGNNKTFSTDIEEKDFSPVRATNSIRISRRNDILIVEAGRDRLKEIVRKEVEFGNGPCGISIPPDKCLKIIRISTNTDPEPTIIPSIAATPKELDEKFARTTDPLEGYWRILDREMDEDLLRMGGDYRLAIIRDGDTYKFIYLGGAMINPDKWMPGMIKVTARQGSAEGLYEIIWFDSSFRPMSKDITGTLSFPVFSIRFPYQNSTLRFIKYTPKEE